LIYPKPKTESLLKKEDLPNPTEMVLKQSCQEENTFKKMLFGISSTSTSTLKTFELPTRKCYEEL